MISLSAMYGGWLTLAVATTAFAGEAPGMEPVLEYAKDNASSGIIVMRGGKVLAQGHWNVAGERSYQTMHLGVTADGESIEDVASVQKSVVSYLVGVAINKSLLRVEDPVTRWLKPGWSSAPAEHENRILVQHLLSMTSGLTLRGEFAAEPGSRWAYNTRIYSRLVPVLEQASGQTIQQIAREWLLDPAGMTESGWYERAWAGQDVDANRLGFKSTATDLARFGQHMLTQLRDHSGPHPVNPAYLQRSLAPSQTSNPAYGYLWWLNGVAVVRLDGTKDESLVPSAPSDLFAALGALGRKLYIVPSQDLIVVRLGDAPPAEDFDVELWRRIMRVL